MTDTTMAIWVLNAIAAMLFSAMLLAHYNSEQPVTVHLYVQGRMEPRVRLGRIIRMMDVDKSGEFATWNGDKIVFPFGKRLAGHHIHIRDLGKIR